MGYWIEICDVDIWQGHNEENYQLHSLQRDRNTHDSITTQRKLFRELHEKYQEYVGTSGLLSRQYTNGFLRCMDVGQYFWMWTKRGVGGGERAGSVACVVKQCVDGNDQ